MSKILLFFVSLLCLGTVILIPVGLIGLYYFSKPSKYESEREKIDISILESLK
jgi:hypothetical protein